MTRLYKASKTKEEMMRVGALHRGCGGIWTSALPLKKFQEEMGTFNFISYTADEIMDRIRCSRQMFNILVAKGYFKEVEN